MKIKNLEILKVTMESSITEVIDKVQKSGSIACALLFNQDKFVCIITDGDLRRAFLAGLKLENSAAEVHEIKNNSARPNTITAKIFSTPHELRRLFAEFSLRQLVLTDEDDRVVAVIDHQEIDHPIECINQSFTALVMAGGFGTRMRPYTVDTPKPMLKVNDRPMLEISIEKLVMHGANRIYISTHYLPEKIIEHFGDGKKFGVEIQYVHESTPLGTGGALSLLPYQDDNTLVFNGDILTNLDIGMFLAFHLRSNSVMTVAATQYHFQVPFGVISEKDSLISRIEEKPDFSFLVNSGIYFLSKSVFEFLPASGHYNMTDVADILLRNNLPVSCFPIFEHWLDVGRPSDYELASKIF